MRAMYLSRIGPVVLVLAILYAGVAKAIQVDEFQASLASWVFLPEMLRAAVALVVPALEVTVALRWFALGQKRYDFTWAPLLLMSTFTAAYLVHYLLASPPDCACFGKWVAYNDERASGFATMLRNCLLLSCGAMGGTLSSQSWVRFACRVTMSVALVSIVVLAASSLAI
ncbi:MAG: hypothetical protein ACI85K_002097 [Hyphomicrobiaceae bacterium]|jgi:hypothetical protein